MSFPELAAEDYFEWMAPAEEVESAQGFGVSCYTGFDASAKPSLGLAPPYSTGANVGLLRRALEAADMLDADDEVSDAAGEVHYVIHQGDPERGRIDRVWVGMNSN